MMPARPPLFPLIFALGLILPALLSARGPASPEPDRDALVALFNVTGGASWLYNDNWMSSARIGEWYGVEVNAEGRVTHLDLIRNELSGEMPPELGDLSSLEWLLLQRNQLSREIPPELGNLASLEWLSLGGNQLSGEIPPELGNLSGLVALGLEENQLSGEIPPELGNLASLRRMDISGNRGIGCPPASLKNRISGASEFCP